MKEDREFGFMGIYAKNREEWVVSDLACMFNDITSVPLYDTLGAGALEFIINQTKIKALCCTADKIKTLIKLKRNNKIEFLETLIVFDEWDHDKTNNSPLNLISYYDAIDEFKTSEVELKDPTIQSILCLCYTSGTTGPPKGAMISQMNMACLVSSLPGTGLALEPWDIHISYLPLAHTFERCIISATYMVRFSVGFYNGNILKLKEDLLELRPTLFASVPRLYNKLYVGIKQRLAQSGCCKRKITSKAIRDKLRNYHENGTVTHSLWDKLIFRVFKRGLGGNVRYMLTASAPIKAEVLDFLKVCFCVPILEGYGQTETAAVSLTSMLDKDTGNVGGPLECCEIKLKDVPDLNYFHTDKPNPRGEICIRGNNLCAGYFRAPLKNKETFDEDGWALSGDIGEFLPNRALKIIDRKKNIFKLSQGEYIAPEKLENTFVESLIFKNVFIYGDSLQDFIVAIVVLEKTEMEKWAREEEIDYENYEEFIQTNQVKKHVLKKFIDFKASANLNSLEIPKRVTIHNEEFTVESGLLTPTFKLKRMDAKAYFLKEIKEMYGGADFQGE